MAVLCGAGCGTSSPSTDQGSAATRAAGDAKASEETEPARSASEPVDVCARFTADDFESVTGAAAAGPGEPQPVIEGMSLGGCAYEGVVGEDGLTVFPASVTISAHPADGFASSTPREADDTLSEVEGVDGDLAALMTPEPFEAEDGIGDEAAFSQTEGLAVLDGDVFYLISANGAVGGDSGSEAMAAMTGAAESKTFVDKDLALAVAEILVGS